MKHVKIIIGVLAVLILVGIGAFMSKEPAAEDAAITLKVGTILPLTGDFGFVGEEMEKGMRLAIANNPDVTVELIVEDDQGFNNSTAVSAARKLTSVDGIDVLLNPAVNTAKVISPVVTESGTPTLVFWDTNKDLRGLSDYVFAMGVSTEGAGRDMARFAAGELGAETVGVIANIDEWSEIISTSFIEEFENGGGMISTHDRVAVGDTDLRTVIARALADNPDAIYFPVFPDASNVLVRQLREQGYKGYLMSGDGFLDINIEALGEYAEGIYVTQLWTEDSELETLYVETYGEGLDAVNLSYAAMAYDAMNAAIEVAQKVQAEGISSRRGIRDKMDGYTFESVAGPVTISAESSGKSEPIVVVKDGLFQLAQ